MWEELDLHPHLEIVRNRKNAINYCRKEDTRHRGPWTNMAKCDLEKFGHGRRTDLEAVRKIYNDKQPLVDIAQQHFGTFLQYHNGGLLNQRYCIGMVYQVQGNQV